MRIFESISAVTVLSALMLGSTACSATDDEIACSYPVRISTELGGTGAASDSLQLAAEQLQGDQPGAFIQPMSDYFQTGPYDYVKLCQNGQNGTIGAFILSFNGDEYIVDKSAFVDPNFPNSLTGDEFELPDSYLKSPSTPKPNVAPGAGQPALE